MSDAHESGHEKAGVMEDTVPTGNLWITVLLIIVVVGFTILGLRKGYETLVEGTIYAQKLSKPDSRLVSVLEKDEALLAGKEVGELIPRMSIQDAVQKVSANVNLLAPMRPASALGLVPTDDGATGAGDGDSPPGGNAE